MSLMDHFLPTYQFSERHHTMIRCAPGELLDIVQNYQPPRDRIGDLLMSIRLIPSRLLHRAAPDRHQAAQPVGIRSFIPLGRDGDREIVAGLVGQFWRANFGLVAIAGPAEYLAFNAPRTAKLALGFAAETVGDMTRFTTETRVHCPDRYSYLRFLPYWLLIRPASGLIRRRALATIRGIAEKREVAPA